MLRIMSTSPNPVGDCRTECNVSPVSLACTVYWYSRILTYISNSSSPNGCVGCSNFVEG